ncbi:NDP-hexose 2,3-dehydratase family protein [Streptomyces sp. CB02414]|uniref:NDP-hexose 2,3-dehydratase family protein n=1 Tax=Streptomyces sp. CB02414 TaxID=1703922 RepID=UPI00093BF2E0|nr:NDP-hexose 2,3-dehydratase family protein [Streptomyces sp. CB02414]OKI84078.1 hypothetical protein AMK11_22275 [Streptomyces sp. CB02414]
MTQAGFLSSALAEDGRVDADAFLKERSASAAYDVTEVPLASLGAWHLGERLVHSSERFFTVEGLAVRTNHGRAPSWCQPIIVQPEIGILGILVKRFDGVPHFLMQVKMEPGNTSLVQYAATVQATPSNYQRVHGGRSTPYLDYFLPSSRRRVLVDRLLSEHAAWYLHKRNRNMIVEVPPDEDVPRYDDFVWLTLGQIRRQLALGQVNMNARTVLACISYAAGGGLPADDFHGAVVTSHRRHRSNADLAEAMTWLIDQKERYTLEVRRVGLSELDEWIADEESIRHRDGDFFRVVGLSVAASSREVGRWSQPMLEPVPGNLVAFLCRRRAGVLEFLVQAMVQPGLTDRLELAATIQLSPGLHRTGAAAPPLLEYLATAGPQVRHSSVQSEDGGRFLRADTQHVVVELPADRDIAVPPTHRWMTLGLLDRLVAAGYYVNVEARSLMACLL